MNSPRAREAPVNHHLINVTFRKWLLFPVRTFTHAARAADILWGAQVGRDSSRVTPAGVAFRAQTFVEGDTQQRSAVVMTETLEVPESAVPQGHSLRSGVLGLFDSVIMG